MEPSETIKNRQAPSIHQPPPSLPGDPALWGSRDGTPSHRACPGAQLLHPPAQAPPPHAASVSPLTEASPRRCPHVPAHRQGCRRGMQPCCHGLTGGKNRPQPWHSSAWGCQPPCLGVLCRDTPALLGKLWANAGGPQTRAGTMSPSPSWPQTHCIEGIPDLQPPGAPGPPQLSPRIIPPAKAGLPSKLVAWPGKAPYQARRAAEGPSGAQTEHWAGGGRGEALGSIPVPCQALTRDQAQLVARLGHAKLIMAGSPVRHKPALPRHRRCFLSPVPGRVHRRSDKRHRRAKKKK